MLSSSSSSMFLSDKERDNTWLQLPVCPLQMRPGQSCPNAADQCAYAHPPEAAMKYVLSNGYIVSCHDFVFSHSGRRGCSRSNCKYFHPPTHLCLLVINAGKNNKRLRNEMMIKQSNLCYPTLWKQQQEAALLMQQQQQSSQALLTAFQPGGQMLQTNSFLGLQAGAASSYLAANPASAMLVSPQNLQKPVEPDPPGTASRSGTPNRKRTISDERDGSDVNRTKKPNIPTLESQIGYSALMQQPAAVFNGHDMQRMYQPVVMQNQMVPMSFLGGYYHSNMMPQFAPHQGLSLQNPALWTYIYEQSLKQ